MTPLAKIYSMPGAITTTGTDKIVRRYRLNESMIKQKKNHQLPFTLVRIIESRSEDVR